jgi:hypothetical protein
MKTVSHLWQYLNKFFLELEMFWLKLRRKSKHTVSSNFCFENNDGLWDNFAKYAGAREAISNITWRMRVALNKEV